MKEQDRTRDDFTQATKEQLAKRVAYICSNPGCRVQTVGPNNDKNKSLNIGVAAHICAASPGGPRYNPGMSTNERKDIENGIWLCQNCAHKIDHNPEQYSVEVLQKWKGDAEKNAKESLGKSSQKSDEVFSENEEFLKVLKRLVQIDRDQLGKIQGYTARLHGYQDIVQVLQDDGLRDIDEILCELHQSGFVEIGIENNRRRNIKALQLGAKYLQEFYNPVRK